jgi:hypothetical protein
MFEPYICSSKTVQTIITVPYYDDENIAIIITVIQALEATNRLLPDEAEVPAKFGTTLPDRPHAPNKCLSAANATPKGLAF